MGRKNIKYQINESLLQQARFGEPKVKSGVFGEAPAGIHSQRTFKEYSKECQAFGRWCVENGLVKNNYVPLETLKQFVPCYIDNNIDRGLSAFTVKKRLSALNKLYGEKFLPEKNDVPVRRVEDITRSRLPAVRDKGFSENKHKDLVTIARATGGRRCDLNRLRMSNFVEKEGKLYVVFEKSKGGRDRITPVLPRLEQEVRKILSCRQGETGDLFKKIPDKMDVHSFRREYAKELYTVVDKDHGLRGDILQIYPARCENVKSDFYRASNGIRYNRDSVYAVTQALGHNRLEVTVNNYLK